MTSEFKNNTLLIDIGNTSLKWALSTLEGVAQMSQQSYPKNISSTFFTRCWQDLNKPNNVILTCVAEASVWQAVQKACDALWDIKAKKVSSLKQGFGLVNAYENPESLGSDRWCAMVAAKSKSDSAFMIVDAGSALTIDIVLDSGEHAGGVIIPGLSMMKKSLGLGTAKVDINTAQSQSSSLALGCTTQDGVDTGVLLSTIKLIEAVYEKELQPLQASEVFITGGDASLIANLLPFKCVIILPLVLDGLAIMAKSTVDNN